MVATILTMAIKRKRLNDNMVTEKSHLIYEFGQIQV